MALGMEDAMEQGTLSSQMQARECESDAHDMHQASIARKSARRMPALLLTFAIELIVGFVFSRFQDTFKRYPLLIGFQTIISAVSGNVGLQAASTNVRALALGLVSDQHIRAGIVREVYSGVCVGTAIALVAGATALIWYSPPISGDDGHTWSGAWAFAFAIAFGQFVSVMTAAVSGAAAPLVFKRCGTWVPRQLRGWFDPTATAGPFETAFQDVIGGTFLLAASAGILAALGDYARQCPGGGINGCIALCRAADGNATVVPYMEACIQSCLHDLDAGIC